MTQVATTQQGQMTAKALFARDDVRAKFQEMMGKRSTQFITSVLQIVASNNLLAKADPNSVYQAAAVAATLDLPLNNNIGHAYIVPYNTKYKAQDGTWQTKTVAQFQIGYKGFIQLAQRSGQFKTISATPIYEGQIVSQDPLKGFVFDFTKRDSDTVVGFAAYFELLNGFEKTLYMTCEEINRHGGRYSQNFSHEKSLWKTDYNGMATKTVLKLLLSKFAPLSVEMQRAVVADQAVVNDADTVDVTYVDNQEPEIDKEEERIALMIQDATTLDQLTALESFIPETLLDAYTAKIDELKANAKRK